MLQFNCLNIINNVITLKKISKYREKIYFYILITHIIHIICVFLMIKMNYEISIFVTLNKQLNNINKNQLHFTVEIKIKI